MKMEKVLVIGAGTMGSGIAQWFCQAGAKVYLSDHIPELVSSSKDKIFKSWDKLEAKGKFSGDQVKSFKENLCDYNEETDLDLVVEAIIENLEIKQKLFADLDAKLPEKTILSSNTSSFPISTLSKSLSEDRKKRFFGLHFFNPATIMKLVEVICSCWSDKNLANDLYKYFEANGKKPAHCSDSPGFIVNRVARNFYGEAFRIAKSEDSERFEEIDKIMKEVGGFRMGPFELMDLIGIDVNFDVTNSVWDAFFKEPRFAPHLLQKKMVDSGRLGKKTKQGFYSYE